MLALCKVLLLYAFSWHLSRKEVQSLPPPKRSRSTARSQTLHLCATALTSCNTRESSACGRGSLLELIRGCTWPSWDGVFSDKCQIWCRWRSLLTNALWNANYLSHCWMAAERQMVLMSLWHLKTPYLILRRQSLSATLPSHFHGYFNTLAADCCFQMVAKCSWM